MKNIFILLLALALSGCGKGRDAIYRGDIRDFSASGQDTYQQKGSEPDVLVKSDPMKIDNSVEIRGEEWHPGFVTFHPDAGEQPLTKQFLHVMNPLWTRFPGDLTERAKVLLGVRDGLRAVLKKATTDEFRTGIQIDIALIDYLLTDSDAAKNDRDALPPGIDYKAYAPPGTTQLTLDEMCFYVKNDWNLDKLKEKSGVIIGQSRWAKVEKRTISPAVPGHTRIIDDSNTKTFNDVSVSIAALGLSEPRFTFHVVVKNNGDLPLQFPKPLDFLMECDGKTMSSVGTKSGYVQARGPAIMTSADSMVLRKGESGEFIPMSFEVDIFSQKTGGEYETLWSNRLKTGSPIFIKMHCPKTLVKSEIADGWQHAGKAEYSWTLEYVPGSDAVEEIDREKSTKEWKKFTRGVDRIGK